MKLTKENLITYNNKVDCNFVIVLYPFNCNYVLNVYFKTCPDKIANKIITV